MTPTAIHVVGTPSRYAAMASPTISTMKPMRYVPNEDIVIPFCRFEVGIGQEGYQLHPEPERRYRVPEKPELRYRVPDKPELRYRVPEKTERRYQVPEKTERRYQVPEKTELRYQVPGHYAVTGNRY